MSPWATEANGYGLSLLCYYMFFSVPVGVGCAVCVSGGRAFAAGDFGGQQVSGAGSGICMKAIGLSMATAELCKIAMNKRDDVKPSRLKRLRQGPCTYVIYLRSVCFARKVIPMIKSMAIATATVISISLAAAMSL